MGQFCDESEKKVWKSSMQRKSIIIKVIAFVWNVKYPRCIVSYLHFIMHQQNIHKANYEPHFDIIHRVHMLVFIFLCSTVLHKLSEFIIIAASDVGDILSIVIMIMYRLLNAISFKHVLKHKGTIAVVVSSF
jgi:hypothetical protein